MSDYDVVLLGAGPGGYVAAIRSAQLGMKTAVVEQEEVGGVCLNWGCIPSKSLLRNAEVLNLVKNAEAYGISFENLVYDYGMAIDRSRKVVKRLTTGVSYLLKKNGVDHIKGFGFLRSTNTVQVKGTDEYLKAKDVIIATGARQRNIPSLPIDREVVITSKEALMMRDVPSRIVIIGGGATGVEFAHLYRSYGSEVTLVEMLPRLIPNEDQEVSSQLERSFRGRGIECRTSTSVQSISVNGKLATLTLADQNGQDAIECDKVLVAVGVQGNLEEIGLEQLGIDTQHGFISIDDNMQTSVQGVYAIGDVTGKLLLAHVASAQGITAVETIAGLSPPALDYSLMPRAIYCNPQVASFGLTEEQARDLGYSIKIGRFPFSASGKAIALGDTDGMVKLVVEAEVGDILGAHMIGAEVTELVGELSIAKMLEGTTSEVGWLVHPHPTISEAIKEAALDAEGEAVHS